MQPAVCSLDLSGAPHDVIEVLLAHMDIQQRFTCALVCSDWAKAAAAATNTIVKHGGKDIGQLQQWLKKHGSHVETFQLRDCSCTLARLPCAQLQDLLLHAAYLDRGTTKLSSRVWSDIAAATKLTSVSLIWLCTESQQADVVSALTALPDLQQLTWRKVICGRAQYLSDSRLLQQLTRLTGLELDYVAAEALQHLSSLTKLQRLSTHSPPMWAAADYPGLQELQGLTSLELNDQGLDLGLTFPACVSHLTALQQLEVACAAFPELNGLTALTALTKLEAASLDPSSTPLQLPVLQHVGLKGGIDGVFHPSDRIDVHTSQLASCTQLRCLSLCALCLMGPGSLVTSSMLQELELQYCSLSSGDNGPAAVRPWELLFPGPGRLPHLTSLVLQHVSPEPQQADVERLVACCSGLRVLRLHSVTDEQCSSLAQLTGLQDLDVFDPRPLSVAGLRQLAHLEQLTNLRFGSELDPRKVSTVLIKQLSDTVPGRKRAIVNKAPAGSPPDVSARLLRACDMAADHQQQP